MSKSASAVMKGFPKATNKHMNKFPKASAPLGNLDMQILWLSKKTFTNALALLVKLADNRMCYHREQFKQIFLAISGLMK
jgi:hypothetical protein